MLSAKKRVANLGDVKERGVKQFYAEQVEPGVVALGERVAGRVMAGLRRALAVVVFGTVALGVILLPDLLFGHGVAQRPKPFFMSLALVSGVLGFAMAMSRMAKRERWIFDVAERALIAERAVFGRELEPEVLELGFVTELRLVERRWPAMTTIEATLSKGDEGAPATLVLVGGWGARLELKARFEFIESALKRARSRICFVRVGAGLD